MNPDTNTPIHISVLKAIASGEVAMRPRWHFVLKTALVSTGGVIVLCAVLYLASFVIFVSRQTGGSFVPIFGSRGWYHFFISLPWVLILLSFIFVIILEILVRRYSFGYRQPLLFSVMGIVVIVVAGGGIVAQTSFHRGLFRYA